MLKILFAILLSSSVWAGIPISPILRVNVSGAGTGESLSAKQFQFSILAARLIEEAVKREYAVTLGEAWRSEEEAKFKIETRYNAARGIGIADSLHILRLAIDINLFKSGKFLTSTSDYKPLGEWWEKQCVGCSWGGRFKRADGNHFSISYKGVR